MYFPNAASGNEWNRMATLSIRFYSLHLRCIVHCINSSYSKYSFSTTNKANHSNLPCGEKMYFPNAASGYEWNRMATLSIRFYSLHLRCIVHCINSSYSKYSFSTTNKTNHSNLPCGEKMYFPNAASGNEWNRMATLSIRFYSLHL